MTARTTCASCLTTLTAGKCLPCAASARRVRSFRAWWGRLRHQDPAVGTWEIRGRIIRHVDPMVPDEPDPAGVLERIGRWVRR